MSSGPVFTVTLPGSPAARAAAAGLIRLPRDARAGRRVRVNLEALTAVVRTHGPMLTPGAVAAHVTGRRLAVRAERTQARRARFDALAGLLTAACDTVPELHGRGPDVFASLRRNGWIARLADADEAPDLLTQAVAVVATVLRLHDGDHIDRRLLVPGDPHALDDGQLLAGLILAILAGLGKAPSSGPTRWRWSSVGVDVDDIVGGLALTGIAPSGWVLPPGAICTLPLRELARISWPEPARSGDWVFVTENPSVLAAAADNGGPVRLVCTLGTPSNEEVEATTRSPPTSFARSSIRG